MLSKWQEVIKMTIYFSLTNRNLRRVRSFEWCTNEKWSRWYIYGKGHWKCDEINWAQWKCNPKCLPWHMCLKVRLSVSRRERMYVHGAVSKWMLRLTLAWIIQLEIINNYGLTHWGWKKIAAIFQTTFQMQFIEWKCMNLRFHWSLFLTVQLTFQHWFR